MLDKTGKTGQLDFFSLERFAFFYQKIVFNNILGPNRMLL